MECRSMNGRPLLHQVVMLLAWSSRKEMTTALEAEFAVLREADRGIGSVDLLLQHYMTAGYRIELEDIENNMMRVTNVARAVVLPVSKDEKIDHLVAFVMLQTPSTLSALKTGLAIKEELKQYLPSYMIPRKIVLRESFPINTNGKVDRKQLAAELK